MFSKGFFLCLCLHLAVYVVADTSNENKNTNEKSKEEKQGFKKYVLDPNFRPPIFGSMKYDAINQIFVEPEKFMNVTKETAYTKPKTTKTTTTVKESAEDLRKHVTAPIFVGQWWKQAKTILNTSKQDKMNVPIQSSVQKKSK